MRKGDRHIAQRAQLRALELCNVVALGKDPKVQLRTLCGAAKSLGGRKQHWQTEFLSSRALNKSPVRKLHKSKGSVAFGQGSFYNLPGEGHCLRDAGIGHSPSRQKLS